MDDCSTEISLSEMKLISEPSTALVCSDALIINANGDVTYESITAIRKRHVFPKSAEATGQLLFRNFAIGCTILMRTELAKAAIPFVSGMVHDHWLALFASTKGRIIVAPKPLIRYRIHSQNQTNVLVGISSKEDYYNARILPYRKQISAISRRIKVGDILPEAQKWAKARVDYYCGDVTAIRTIWKYRRLNKSTSFFEIAMKFMPNWLFRWVLKKIQRCEI